MINVAKIQDSLIGLIGFKQPFNPDYAIIDADNLLSSSGYFVTNNPYAKIEYLKDAQDFIDQTSEQFNDSLRVLKSSAISSVVNQVFSEYDFIDRNLLFKNTSRKANTDVLPNGFVGFRIEVGSTKNIAFKLGRVLLDFQGTGTIKLLLWNTAKLEALESKEIDITTDHQEEVLDWVLDNSADTYKGDYYVGYISSDASGLVPYKRDYENGNVMSVIKYLCIEPISFPGHSTEILFDVSKYQGLSECTGLNFDISVYDDYTDFVINNKQLFARAIYLETVIMCLGIYLSSLRINSNERASANLVQLVMAEIEGTSSESTIKVVGLKNQLINEITQIRQEINKIKVGVKKTGQILVSTLQ